MKDRESAFTTLVAVFGHAGAETQHAAAVPHTQDPRESSAPLSWSPYRTGATRLVSANQAARAAAAHVQRLNTALLGPSVM
jgi:hypothetical protein